MSAADRVVVYDGECPVCRTATRAMRAGDRRERCAYVSVHDQAGLTRHDLRVDESARGSILVYRGGEPPLRESRAIAAIVETWPVLGPALSRAIVLALPVADPVYRLVARNRHRISAAFARAGGLARRVRGLASR
jgi:predicted DCC family thiol-disulfide oxidoreductase YuxK